MKSISKKIDKLFTSRLRNQIIAFIVLNLVIIILSWGFFYCPVASLPHKAEPIEKTDPLWWVFLHLIYPGNLSHDTSSPYFIKIIGIIITLLGMLFFEGLLIGFVVRNLEHKVEIIRKGLSRHKFSNHVVIIGWDTFAISLIKRILSENAVEKDMPEIVILHDGDAEELFQKIKSNLEQQEWKNVFVYYGELIKKEFDQLCLNDAEELYILGRGGEIGANNSNIEILFSISELIHAKEKKLNCYINFPETESFNIIKKQGFPDSLTKKLNLKPFNLNEGWARKLWESIDHNNHVKGISNNSILKNIIGKMDSSSYLHFVIIGFNEMGYSLLEQTIQLAHFNTDKPTLITILDSNFSGRDKKFMAEYPFYTSISDCKISFIEKDVYNQEIRNQLCEWNSLKDCHLIISICKTNPDISFTTAGLLPSEIIDSKTPILVYQKEGKGYELLVTGMSKQKQSSNIIFFGWLDEHCDMIKIRDRLAEGIHQEYLNLAKSEKRYDKDKPNFYEWDNLPEVYKDSNKHQADSFVVKLKRIGKKLVKDDGKGELIEFTENELETLARMEHDRWCAERIMNGWQYGKVRDNDKKIHPDLIPFDQLSDEVKKYDYNAVKQIPNLLRKYCQLSIADNG